MDERAIRRHIVKRLLERKAFVHGHLLGERLERGLPSHLRGAAKYALAQLVKEDIVVVYGPTRRGLAYQLNVEKLDEIEQILQE